MKIYFSKLLKTNLIPETVVSQTDPTSIYLLEISNYNSNIKCKTCSKLTTETSDVIMFSLLLTLDIFDMVLVFFCLV